MRRLLALATLLVLSLSRFGAPAPVHAHRWVVDRVSIELGAAVPGARLAAPMVRDMAQRVPPRAAAPWVPFDGASGPGLELRGDARPVTPAGGVRPPLTAWHRFTYDATAPPLVS
jgi:hypothetical protein